MGAVLAEVGDSVAVHPAPDPHRHVVGAGDRVGVEVDVEAVLAEAAGGRGGRLGRAARVDVFVIEPLLELTGPIGRVAGDLGVVAPAVVIEEIIDEVLGDRGVAGVAGSDDGVVMISLSGSTATWPLYPSKPRAWVLCP